MGAACYYCPLLGTPCETLLEQESGAQMHDTTENRPERNGGLTEMQAFGYFHTLLPFYLHLHFLHSSGSVPFPKKNLYLTFNKKLVTTVNN